MKAFSSQALLAVVALSVTVTGDECQPVTWKRELLPPGEVNCRHSIKTPHDVGLHTCEAIASQWDMSVEALLRLNPEVGKDCSSIMATQEVCVRGFIEPLRAWDGLCGPLHNNATCIGTDKQCCNSKSWTCGDSEEDCSAPICYEGDCK